MNMHSLLQEDVVSFGTMTARPRSENHRHRASRADIVSPAGTNSPRLPYSFRSSWQAPRKRAMSPLL